jgi:hypothetical protein
LGHTEAVILLLEAGTYCLSKDEDGQTARDLALQMSTDVTFTNQNGPVEKGVWQKIITVLSKAAFALEAQQAREEFASDGIQAVQALFRGKVSTNKKCNAVQWK